MAALTQYSVDNSDPKTAPYEIRDTGGKGSIKGLLLRIQPSGTKTFYVEPDISIAWLGAVGKRANWVIYIVL